MVRSGSRFFLEPETLVLRRATFRDSWLHYQALLRSEQRFTESSGDHPNRKMAIVTDHNSRFDVLCILARFIESAILDEPKMRLPQLLSGGMLSVPRPVDSHSCEVSILIQDCRSDKQVPTLSEDGGVSKMVQG